MTSTVELEDIRAELPNRIEHVLSWAGIEVRRPRRGWWFGPQCPTMHHGHSPRAFSVNPETGVWGCHCCGTSGDLLDLIAMHKGLATNGPEFVQVKAIGADLAGVAGVELTPEERAQRRRERQEERAQRRREAEERRQWERAYAIPRATAYWQQLKTSNGPAERYLAERGLSGAIERGIVRFDACGDYPAYNSLALAVRTSDGLIVNVKRRRLPEYATTPDDRFRPLPKHYSAYADGTYVGALCEIAPGRHVLLTEGFADAITAALAWPTATIIGAQSTSDLADLAEYAAPRVVRAGSQMLIAPHRDDGGLRAAVRAGKAAIAAGLRFRETLHIVKHGADDLNAAWVAGWRP